MSAELEAKLKKYRFSHSEYERIKKLLEREPQGLEWAIFSALWSEHCSYKSSKKHLKKFAKTLNERVISPEGENAGILDLGQGEMVAFKMESHNHPSFIEPYQGAATGVGGILRDIFTMGARPIALANYLCFGENQARHWDQVVRGIGGYGNCVGVPTVTGQVNFDSKYNSNILVNAFALGVFDQKNSKVALSRLKEPGGLILYVGAKTGKDGVHGAAMASESFDENSDSKRPNIQIGDPFFEKLLIEACLEAIQTGLVDAIQDMGAAGLTSSSFEMSVKSGFGFLLRLDQIPLRDATMSAEEIMLSESQERMLLVAKPPAVKELMSIFERWGLDCVVVGEVRAEKEFQIYEGETCLLSLDPKLIVDDAPVYDRPYEVWRDWSWESLEQKLNQKRFLACDLEFSRQQVYEQFDQMVGLRTVRSADQDVAFLLLKQSQRALAIAVGCRPSVMEANAGLGAMDAFLYPAFQMSIKGAVPMGMTDCLNFGNPEKVEIMSDFVVSVETLAEAGLACSCPVISGNVSFYNETLGKNIISTPAVAVVGLRSHVNQIPWDSFQEKGNWVILIDCPLVSERSAALKQAGQYLKCLQEFSRTVSPVAAQMVSLLGLKQSLQGMEGKGLFCKVKDNQTGRRFYQVIFEIRNEDESHCQQVLQGLDETLKRIDPRASVQVLGEVQEKNP
ncbi:MAG: phosphoribosylformylglycinamidine synthase subunit PurL [Proteobacteria bacterium]|nr:phosphoribosylformylglycinamidine synthase subunit PurL [Pseudomonadota bacterium]